MERLVRQSLWTEEELRRKRFSRTCLQTYLMVPGSDPQVCDQLDDSAS